MGPQVHSAALTRIKQRVATTVSVIVGLLCSASAYSVEDEATLWRALQSGEHVALLRHALAPGTGDPPAFTLRDCSTQRNLSSVGRDQASRIGARFRANGIPAANVYSSQWCRCLETARLLELGRIQELPILNSFFRRDERQDQQTQELKTWLRRQDLKEITVLVTHQVNITSLTDVFPASGELIILRRNVDGQLSVTGTIKMD